MTAQLNIKSEEAWGLAYRLSELTGESLPTVVTWALRDEFAREEQVCTGAVRKARLQELAGEIRANVPPAISANHDWLYDETTGLPA